MKRRKRKSSPQQSKTGLSGSSAHGALEPHAREGHARMAGGEHLGQAESEGRARRERQEIDSGAGGDGSSLLDGNGGVSGGGCSDGSVVDFDDVRFELRPQGFVGVGSPLSPPPDTESVRARVRLAAQHVDPHNRLARFRFLAGLGSDFIKGTTARDLAEVWGLSVGTVSNDATDAWLFINGDPAEDVKAIAWGEALRQLADARADYHMFHTSLKQYRGEDGGLTTTPLEMKLLSDALGRAQDSLTKVMDWIGRASGLHATNTKPDVTVNVQVGSTKTEMTTDFAFAIARSVLESPSSPQRTAILAKAAEYSGAALPQIVESR